MSKVPKKLPNDLEVSNMPRNPMKKISLAKSFAKSIALHGDFENTK